MSDILHGLGKSTRRGVRSCPKCNTKNGTRSLSCKNRSCDVIFKSALEASNKRSRSLLNRYPIQPGLVRVPGKSQPSLSYSNQPKPELECCRLITDSGAGRAVFAVKEVDSSKKDTSEANETENNKKRGFLIICDPAECPPELPSPDVGPLISVYHPTRTLMSFPCYRCKPMMWKCLQNRGQAMIPATSLAV